MKNIFQSGVKEELISRLKNLKSDSVGKWGVMKPNEMLHHLTMANQLATGELVLPDKSSWSSRTIFWWMTSLYIRPSEKRLKKKPLRSFKQVDIVRNKIPVSDLESEKNIFINKLDEVISLEKFPIRHPLFGKMNRTQWGRWVYVHAHYHFEQFGV